MTTTPLLTDAEHDLVDRLGSCFTAFKKLNPDKPQQGEIYDVAEFASRIHDLQARVLSRAAARAYPDRYRVIGGGARRL